MVKTFKPQDNSGRKLKSNRIACCPNGDMVVADNFEKHHRYMLTKDGEYKTAMMPQVHSINYVSSIAINPDGYIAVTDWTSPFVTIFDPAGNFVHQFQAAPDASENELRGLAVDTGGNLIVQDCQQCTITRYSCPDGRQLSQATVGGTTHELPRIAIDKKGQLIFYDDTSSTSTGATKVIALNHAGEEVFSISPQIGERVSGKTYSGMEVGLCGLTMGGENDDIFIAMKICIHNIDTYSSRIGRSNTGHIHRYNSMGEFQQCIIRGLHSPHDLAMTPDGSLVIANDDSILKYSVVPAAVAKSKRTRKQVAGDRAGMERVV